MPRVSTFFVRRCRFPEFSNRCSWLREQHYCDDITTQTTHSKHLHEDQPQCYTKSAKLLLHNRKNICDSCRDSKYYSLV